MRKLLGIGALELLFNLSQMLLEESGLGLISDGILLGASEGLGLVSDWEHFTRCRLQHLLSQAVAHIPLHSDAN
jgi:hypothetical protein